MSIKELLELDLLLEIIIDTEDAEVESLNNINIVTGTNGKNYNIDKIRKRADTLFDKFMNPYAI